MTASLWQAIHDNKPVVDLHIHPAMNRLVIKQNLGLRYVVSRSFNPLAVRASWPRLQRWRLRRDPVRHPRAGTRPVK